jgi:hypothetical protein
VVVDGALLWSMDAHRSGWGSLSPFTITIHWWGVVVVHVVSLLSVGESISWLGLGWEGSPMDDEQDSSFIVWFPHCQW